MYFSVLHVFFVMYAMYNPRAVNVLGSSIVFNISLAFYKPIYLLFVWSISGTFYPGYLRGIIAMPVLDTSMTFCAGYFKAILCPGYFKDIFVLGI